MALIGCGSDDGTATNSQGASTTEHVETKVAPNLPARMPSFLGSSFKETVSRLKSEGAKLTLDEDTCPTTPLSGEVSRQVPSPHERIGRDPRIYLQSDHSSNCGNKVNGPPCEPDELQFTVKGKRGNLNGEEGATAVEFEIVNQGKSDCNLRGLLQLHLTPEADQPGTEISGNPYALALRRGLTSGRTLTVLWLWHNWCGTRGPFTASTTFQSATETTTAPSPPCLSEHDGSDLSNAGVAGF